ncbi:hypothetical protein P3T39_001591 [Kitasatospora sp. GP82]|nr:hypothetical protein [Kitasatospora sp. GP82]
MLPAVPAPSRAAGAPAVSGVGHLPGQGVPWGAWQRIGWGERDAALPCVLGEHS